MALSKKSNLPVVASDTRHPFDLNNDGVVDVKDFQHGLSIATLATALAASGVSPAAAKGGCFVADTRVALADGSTTPIQNISVGATVQSWDTNTGTVVNATVLSTVHVQRRELMDVILETGDIITSTVDHPWWSHFQGAIVSLDPDATEAEYGIRGVRMMLEEEILEDAKGLPVKATIKRREVAREPVDVMTLKLDRGHW